MYVRFFEALSIKDQMNDFLEGREKVEGDYE